MYTEATTEHQWLKKLIGTWDYETEPVVMEEGKPPVKLKGSETVRSLGEFWVLCEGEGDMPGGGTARTLMTLGYDSEKDQYVGTYIGSMMSYLWRYDAGALDSAGKMLMLEADGPSMSGDGSMARYRDIIEFKSKDHRLLRAQYKNDDGKWDEFMVVHYHRAK